MITTKPIAGPKRTTPTKEEARGRAKSKEYIPAAAGLKEGDETIDVKRLQNYLRKFGYMAEKPGDESRAAGMEAPATQEGKFDARTASALKKFQKRNGLKVTGVLDESTLELMQRPRCGFTDAIAFTLQGSRWNTNNLTYGFANFTPDLTQAQTRAAIAQAFNLWSAVTPLTFTEIPAANNPQILIRFDAGNHGDGSDFDGPGGVLAHAYYPPPGGGPLAGDTHFDEAENWSVNTPPSGIDLVTVAAHEFGHALGLAHSTVAGALMAAFYNGAHRNLEQDDISGIQAIYGRRSGGWHSLGGVITSRITMGRNADGRLEIFVRGTNNAVYHKWQTAPNNGWSGWSSLGGVITSNIAVGQNADGRLEIFARGTNNAVFHNWQVVPNGNWSGWHSLGGVITSNICVAKNADGRLEIFVCGTNGAVWHKWQIAPNGSWSGWSSLGGVITSDITLGQNADGRLELFVRGTNNAVYHKWQTAPNNGWSGWSSLGGIITSQIAIGRNADRRLELFVRGTNNAVFHNWQVAPNSSWSGWHSLGGVITSDIGVTSNADGRLEIFVRGTDDGVHHKWQVAPNGTWSGWSGLGGLITSEPVASQNADGRIELMVRGRDGAVWHRWQTAPSNGWN